MNIAVLCEKLHVLPSPGGLLDQDEKVITRLMIILDHLDDYRSEEMKKASSSSTQ